MSSDNNDKISTGVSGTGVSGTSVSGTDSAVNPIVKRPIIRGPFSVELFKQTLIDNPGAVIIKFGAEWCGPCKRIQPTIDNVFSVMPPQVQCVVVDVDESLEIYSFLRKRKMLNGVPAVLVYKKGNLNYIPDYSVIGADMKALTTCFNQCLHAALANA